MNYKKQVYQESHVLKRKTHHPCESMDNKWKQFFWVRSETCFWVNFVIESKKDQIFSLARQLFCPKNHAKRAYKGKYLHILFIQILCSYKIIYYYCKSNCIYVIKFCHHTYERKNVGLQLFSDFSVCGQTRSDDCPIYSDTMSPWPSKLCGNVHHAHHWEHQDFRETARWLCRKWTLVLVLQLSILRLSKSFWTSSV